MKQALALALFAFVATADGAVAITPQIQNALTTIDTVPTQGQLDAVFSDHAQALNGLSTIASDASGDPGIRLHAIHALTKYCVAPCGGSDTAHQTLVDLIAANASETTGARVVMLRGAIEAIGPQRVSTDWTVLVQLLDHQSRDIRAASAHALRDLCNTQAINPLRVRYQHESTDQVRLAISDALRALPCQ